MITVLRLGHRRSRDARISTHCGLVARALGAERIIYTGEKDDKLLESVRKVASNWGGPFDVAHEKSWKSVVRNFDGVRVHLTMYGLPFQDELKKIDAKKDVLVIIGGEKVPAEVYHSVDFNLAVTSQPHSEIAALALFLDRLQNGAELEKKFLDYKLKVKPMPAGKFVEGH
ncbi:tRNA (cytidine(56)-2'-O)-methyltransferase [Candidatus Micrarchaeota archaeon]|nr:tRNA (cytidine(56)-2'-O)-methyltransferase [Candidatus Micrarchaeota archaeon]